MYQPYLQATSNKPSRPVTQVKEFEVPTFNTKDECEKWIKLHALDFEACNIRCAFIGQDMKRYVDIKAYVRKHHMF